MIFHKKNFQRVTAPIPLFQIPQKVGLLSLCGVFGRLGNSVKYVYLNFIGYLKIISGPELETLEPKSKQQKITSRRLEFKESFTKTQILCQYFWQIWAVAIGGRQCFLEKNMPALSKSTTLQITLRKNGGEYFFQTELY